MHFTLSTFPVHASMQFTVYLCISLPTFPAHASMHFTLYLPNACLSVDSAHASMHFTVYLACACIYALHSVLALRMPLRISLSTLCVPLCISLSTSPQAFVHCTLCLPHACLYALHCLLFYAFRCLLSPCLYAFHCLLSLRMPPCIALSAFHARASMQFTVYFPCARICALHSALALCLPLCISLCTCPLHAFMHFTLSTFPVHASMHFTAQFLLRMPLRMSLCAFSMHASTHFTFYFPTLQPELRGCTSCTTFVLKSYDFELRGRTSRTTFVLRSGQFRTSTMPIPAQGRVRTARIAKNNQRFLHLDHADLRRAAREPQEWQKETRSFCTSTTPTLRGSHIRRARLVSPRRLKIILRKRASFLVQVMLVREGTQDR